jgi:hypothetical protein
LAREQKFAFEQRGDQRVVVRWTGMWKNVEVLLDGQVLGPPFPSFKTLKQGRGFPLPDGRTLHVKYVAGAFKEQGLDLRLDGRPLAGSSQDPREQLKSAAAVVYVVAGLSALLGILGMAGVAFLAANGIGWPSLVAGVVLGVLGYLGARYRSRTAFAVAAGIILIDLVLSLAVSVEAGGRLPTTGIVIRVFILLAIYRGFVAVGQVSKVEAQELADTFR